ncbi:hypothetical protein B0H19DRAFT_1085476 [Mycena capillaripes]|nr:hypothetical protein B0H19DRAFT_1085476 [Mycena capillaripes]
MLEFASVIENKLVDITGCDQNQLGDASAHKFMALVYKVGISTISISANYAVPNLATWVSTEVPNRGWRALIGILKWKLYHVHAWLMPAMFTIRKLTLWGIQVVRGRAGRSSKMSAAHNPDQTPLDFPELPLAHPKLWLCRYIFWAQFQILWLDSGKKTSWTELSSNLEFYRPDVKESQHKYVLFQFVVCWRVPPTSASSWHECTLRFLDSPISP